MSEHCYINSISVLPTETRMSGGHHITTVIEPDVKGLVKPGEARRMSRLLKRAVATSYDALHRAGITCPDAIITGTGHGCYENTERILTDLTEGGEPCSRPTLFMQSTHNTISSTIAILLGCHGYNNTFAHGRFSLESAMLDALLLIATGRARDVLVGYHDELTPLLSHALLDTDPAECSLSMILSSQRTPDSLYELTPGTTAESYIKELPFALKHIHATRC